MKKIIYYYVDFSLELGCGVEYQDMKYSKIDYLIFSLQDTDYIRDTGKLAIL